MGSGIPLESGRTSQEVRELKSASPGYSRSPEACRTSQEVRELKCETYGWEAAVRGRTSQEVRELKCSD